MTLDVVDLHVHYGGTHAVRGATLRVAESELVAILGPSGSGKSSLLHAAAGFVPASGGAVRVNGVDVTTAPPDARGLPIVFQGGHLFAHMRAWENVAFGLRMRGVPRTARRELALEALHEVELVGFEERYPAELSGGQAQRVALARALVLRPDDALFDEPFSHLDPGLARRMHDLLDDLRARRAFGGLFVTHDYEEAFRLADRVAIMLDGRIVQVGKPREIHERPATAEVAAFLGLTNVIEGDVARGRLRVPPFGELPTSRADGRVRVVLRPETLALHPASSRRGVRARIATVRDAGEITRYQLDVEGTWLRASALGPPAWAVGERVRVELSESPWVLDEASEAPARSGSFGVRASTRS